MAQVNYAVITNDFIKNGFFSEYLPPAFSINHTFNPCDIDLASSDDLAEPLSFNMSRFTEDGKRRTIYVPEFSSYIKTVKYMKDKNLIEDLILITQDEHSFSPLIQKNGELTHHERIYDFGITVDEADQEAFRSTYIPNVVEKIRRAKGASGILSLDISNFYSSVYTHLIPSIKLGYDNAEIQYKAKKANNNDPVISEDYRTYVALDMHVRNMNGARTNGLLPGTLISQFLAEALLCRVDTELEAQNIKFVRYVDDYEIFIYDENDITRIQSVVTNTLEKYFLRLNNEKTKYSAFPYYVVENLEKLYSDYTREPINTTEAMQLFNTFFELERNGTKGAIRFLIKSLNHTFVAPDDELFSAYLFNVLVNDSRSLVKICDVLIKRKAQMSFGANELQLIDGLLKKNINNNCHLETIWLLYLRKKLFDEELTDEITNQIVDSDNDLAKIILLEEFNVFLSESSINRIKATASSWLLCYQLYFHGYIDRTEFSSKTHIAKNDAFYARLKREGFSFYKSV